VAEANQRWIENGFFRIGVACQDERELSERVHSAGDVLRQPDSRKSRFDLFVMMQHLRQPIIGSGDR
jgi:hypothetical protein